MKTQIGSPKSSRTCRWNLAIAVLVQGGTIDKAAEAAGVNPATVYRWQNGLEFQEALTWARREAFGKAMGRLQQAANTAVDTLIGIMNDPGARGRVQACKIVLELSQKSLEMDDLKLRVAKQEKLLAALTAQLTGKDGSIPVQVVPDGALDNLSEEQLLENLKLVRETEAYVQSTIDIAQSTNGSANPKTPHQPEGATP